MLYTTPMVICASLMVLAALQILPALLLIAVIGFLTAVVRPIVVSRIRNELSDDIRATMLLASCRHLSVLVTSREVLHLRGENEILVPPLAVPPQEPRTTLCQVDRSTGAGRRGALVAAARGPRCFGTSFLILSFCRYNNWPPIAGGEPNRLRDTVLHDND